MTSRIFPNAKKQSTERRQSPSDPERGRERLFHPFLFHLATPGVLSGAPQIANFHHTPIKCSHIYSSFLLCALAASLIICRLQLRAGLTSSAAGDQGAVLHWGGGRAHCILDAECSNQPTNQLSWAVTFFLLAAPLSRRPLKTVHSLFIVSFSVSRER
jgi:hypothetical protein